MIALFVCVVAYICIGAFVGKVFYDRRVFRCKECASSDRWDRCYDEHGMVAYGLGSIWPIGLFALAAINLAAKVSDLPERRDQARAKRREDEEFARQEAIRFLESKGVDADWLK